MRPRAFHQVDVFTDRPLLGNPLAVVHDADDLDAARMQSIARWTNLSETAFLLTPTDAGADYRVRIFTPDRELPFAGHPTLGSCHAWLDAGGRPRDDRVVVQQCEVGRVRVRRVGLHEGRGGDAGSGGGEVGGGEGDVGERDVGEGDVGEGGVGAVAPVAAGPARLAFAAPPLRRARVEASLVDRAIAAFGLRREQVVDAQWLVNGPHWLCLLLDSADSVLALEPDAARMGRLDHVGVVGPRADAGPAFEVRGFVGGARPFEDPVTGSLNAGIAEWLMDAGRAPPRYVAAQGARLGRAGRVRLERDAEALWVGGDCITVVRGEARL